MKRIFAVLLCYAVFALSLCACNNADTENKKSSEAPTSSTSSLENETVENQAKESLSEKLIREIDAAYIEAQKEPENGTTIGMIELADEYTAKWKQVSDEYYDKIMKYTGAARLDGKQYSADELHTFVSDMKTNREAEDKVNSENCYKELQNTYGGGSAIGPIFANYKYEMQKEWALKLVEIYQQLSAE